ncbi:hypothetical protein Cgig2_010301 [Carnegiea gigantea]|uniref:Uncharacterized protein n=1 Tax=Carnegiea gigantea TaxID=171969 RepID=A0A9Q1KJI0_9CARY|nr:hypothetical protein Cgig2_010301 [Carnegiea gigantea]
MHEYQLPVPKKKTEPSGRKGKRAPTSLCKTYLLCKVYPNSRAQEEQQEQEQKQQEVEPITAEVPINTNSTVGSPPTLNRTHGLTTYALEDPQIHDNSQTRIIFQPSPISMYTDPRINILPGHCSADQEQGATGFDSYDALDMNNALHTSNLDELSAIFRNKGQWNSFLNDLRVDNTPLNDLPSSSNSFSTTAFDKLSAIFQDQVNRSRRS